MEAIMFLLSILMFLLLGVLFMLCVFRIAIPTIFKRKEVKDGDKS